MKKRETRSDDRQLISICGLLLFALSASCKADDKIPIDELPVAMSNTPAAHLERVVPTLLKTHKVPGAAIAVVDEGRLVWQRGFGLADKPSQRPVDEETVFNVASLSKPVTAWGVMHLVEAGAIDLDEPVETYVRRWRIADSGLSRDGITVRRLLSHTAGLSMPSIPGFPEGSALPTLEQTLAGIYEGSVYAKPGTGVELVQEPGSGFAYSGGGYVLLQLLIEEVTGTRFEEHMKRTVLDPLEMKTSRFGWDARSTHCATPYMSSGRAERTFRFAGTAGAGLYATAGDIARFVAANLSGSDDEQPGRGILRSQTVETMLSPEAATRGSGAQEQEMMALGFYVGRLAEPDMTLISHSGGNAGWRSRFVGVRDLGKAIIVLTNSDNGARLIHDVVCSWGEIALGLGAMGECQT